MTKATLQLAIVLDGVSAKWQANIVQVLAMPTSVQVTVDGHGVINPTAFLISKEQARHLAAEINGLLGLDATL